MFPLEETVVHLSKMEEWLCAGFLLPRLSCIPMLVSAWRWVMAGQSRTVAQVPSYSCPCYSFGTMIYALIIDGFFWWSLILIACSQFAFCVSMMNLPISYMLPSRERWCTMWRLFIAGWLFTAGWLSISCLRLRHCCCWFYYHWSSQPYFSISIWQ